MVNNPGVSWSTVWRSGELGLSRESSLPLVPVDRRPLSPSTTGGTFGDADTLAEIPSIPSDEVFDGFVGFNGTEFLVDSDWSDHIAADEDESVGASDVITFRSFLSGLDFYNCPFSRKDDEISSLVASISADFKSILLKIKRTGLPK